MRALVGGQQPKMADKAGSELRPLILITSVEMFAGQRDTLEVRDGDEPVEVAKAFCRKHGLPDTVVGPLTQHVVDKLRVSHHSACTTVTIGHALTGYSNEDTAFSICFMPTSASVLSYAHCCRKAALATLAAHDFSGWNASCTCPRLVAQALKCNPACRRRSQGHPSHQSHR